MILLDLANTLTDNQRNFIGGAICGAIGASLVWYIAELITTRGRR